MATKDIKQGQLFLTTSSWEAFHMRKNPHGIWVHKQIEGNTYHTYLIYPHSNIIKSTIPSGTPAMYIGTDGRPHVGVFLVADTFLELPYSILKQIEEVNNDNS